MQTTKQPSAPCALAAIGQGQLAIRHLRLPLAFFVAVLWSVDSLPGATIADLALLPPNTPVTIDEAVILSTTNLEPDPLYRSFQLRDASRAITVFGTPAQIDPVLAAHGAGDVIEISGLTARRGGTLMMAGGVGGFAVSCVVACWLAALRASSFFCHSSFVIRHFPRRP